MTTDSHPQSSSLAHLRHELRTPINAIIGYSEMLVEELEESAEDEGIFQLQEIRESGIQLLSVVNTELNPIQLDDPQLDLEELVSNRELQIQLQTPAKVAIDYCQALSQSLSARSTGELQGDIQKIEQSARRLLEMTDNLIAIVREPIEINSRANSLDSQIIQELEAQIEIDRTTEEIERSPVNKENNSSNSAKVSTILLVDDNQSNLDLLSWQIEGQGHKVVTANNGRDALHKIQKGDYDLILLDIIMPEVNGYQLLTILRNSAYTQWQHIPIIMISALDEIDSVVKCIELGAEDYLTKPFNPTLLRARINACLEKKRMRDREVVVLSQLTQAHQEITSLNQRLKAENNRLSAEVEVTQRLQTMILPKEQELSEINNLEIAGFMQSADEVGGDYYDVLQSNGGIKFGIGDVTGHGLESGVLMLMVQTAVRTLMESNLKDPKQFLAILNRTIYKNLQRMDCDKNLTLCLVDYQDSKLTLSGQHEEILVINSQGAIRRIDTIDLGFPIGLEEDISEFIFQAEIELDVGDVVILYTDGITEAENYLGEHYGLERLCQIVQKNYQNSAKEIRTIAIEDIKNFIGDRKVYDDITLVVIKQQ